jgi:two-component system sensor histidine kinase KdpD
MFERFTRGPSSAPGDGSGLGLTICRAIVEAHRGRVWARNHPDGGASVIMEFPLTEGPPSEVADD